MDANGNLYVSDDLNNRVQKFALQTTINNNYTAPSPGIYTAVVTFTTGCKESSNPITIEGSANPSITIAASANPINICTNVSFTAVTMHAGSNPSFQWKINGIDAGTNQSTFQTGRSSKQQRGVLCPDSERCMYFQQSAFFECDRNRCEWSSAGNHDQQKCFLSRRYTGDYIGG
ncbi:MAG: hypothetical protein WDM78_02950 [Puia sp.]